MSPDHLACRNALIALTKANPNAAVRHRAHVLLASLDSPSVHAAADGCGVHDDSIRRWWKRFLAEGRDGLADRPRPGRPRKLPEEALVVLRDALAASPDAQGYPTSIWTIADLTDLLGRKGWTVSVTTVHRTVHAEGYGYRRPRHDLAHRQDIDAVASAAHVLETLQKGGLLPPTATSCSISMSASFTPIPSWIVAGSDGASPLGSPLPERTSASRCSGR